MTRRHLLGSAILLGLLIPALSPAQPAAPPPVIHWGTCDPGLVGGEFPALGKRLQCGTMRAPLDHKRPEFGDLEIGVVRVEAGKPEQRQGALFFNPGGPGGNPAGVIPAFAELWGMAEPQDPMDGSKKALMEKFDFVGVIPRGLFGSTEFLCGSREILRPHHDMTDDRSLANIRLIASAAAMKSRACRQSPNARYINTEQTAHDMDMVRRALGETRINYYGISYGTWLGAWYGAMYPEHVGRLFLDANVDWTSGRDDFFLARAPERQRIFEQFTAGAAAARPDIYGLGTDAGAIASRFAQLPPRVRSAARAVELEDPAMLLAIYTVGPWLHRDPGMTREVFDRRVLGHTFSTDPTVNETAEFAASRFAEIYFAPPSRPSPVSLDYQDSMVTTVLCNDTMSIADPAYWVGKGDEYARRYPVGGSVDTFQRCLGWGGPSARLPDFKRLGQGGQILMVQAEYDPQTPLAGALRAFEATADARMIVARGMVGHAVFNYSGSVCMEQAIGRYLLTGELPSERLTECSPGVAVRADSDSHARDESPRARDLREQITEILVKPTSGDY